jgi:HEAT repeat protein
MQQSILWALALLLPFTVNAQTIGQSVARASSGTVRLSFPARPGVCGNGANDISTHRSDEEWESDCEAGPVRVALRVSQGRVFGLRTYVGGRWRQMDGVTDLGIVRPQAAAEYLLSLARLPERLDEDPLLPATLADSVTIWPSLLRLARDANLPSERRRSAVFWLSQAAETAAGNALDSVVSDNSTDREVRKQAVFALSQRDPTEGVPRLIHVVKTNPDPELRKAALFWLGQSDDPRALDLFEQLLQ